MTEFNTTEVTPENEEFPTMSMEDMDIYDEEGRKDPKKMIIAGAVIGTAAATWVVRSVVRAVKRKNAEKKGIAYVEKHWAFRNPFYTKEDIIIPGTVNQGTEQKPVATQAPVQTQEPQAEKPVETPPAPQPEAEKAA